MREVKWWEGAEGGGGWSPEVGVSPPDDTNYVNVRDW